LKNLNLVIGLFSEKEKGFFPENEIFFQTTKKGGNNLLLIIATQPM